MRLSQLANEIVTPDPQIAGLTADSREVGKGFLFAALPGQAADGVKFIPQAEERGAAAVLARPGARSKLPIIIDDCPRRRLSHMAARFYPGQPQVIAGITGTNGKTSTARFASELWSLCGKNAGSLGTLGAVAHNFERKLNHTTPEPVTLHNMLHDMAGAAVTHLAMEVSSHGLAQYRADNVKFCIAAFTNISQDHLDYHDGFEDYFAAKMRLFTDLLPPEGAVVINMDGAGGEEIKKLAAVRGFKVITTGAAGADLTLVSSAPHHGGLKVDLSAGGGRYTLNLPLIGAFQAENALLAAGVIMASGEPAELVIPLLEKLSGVPGRMQCVAEIDGGAIYVDYAHTPNAVATALQAIRPHADGRVIAIIGAGGDRDKEKRQLMGEAAAEYADAVIVTDDNPRSEDPAAIRAAVLRGCPDAEDIGDRGTAIARGVAMVQKGDVLLIAGKGHEAGQLVGNKILPFDDAAAAKAAAANRMKELE